MAHTPDIPPGRCQLDGDRPRPVDNPASRVCATHRERLGELLDPGQRGQTFHKPDERRILPSIPVLYRLLPVERGRGAEQITRFVPQSTPPGDVTAMAHRDRRSVVDDDSDPGAPLSALGTLAAIAVRLDLRDIDNRPVPLPRLDPPAPPPIPVRKYPDIVGLAGAQFWQSYQLRPVPTRCPVRDLATWLHLRLDHLCAVDWVDAVWDDLRRLHSQLAGRTGEAPPRPLGPCRKRVDDDGRLDPDGQWECGVPLYLPPQGLKGMDEDVHLPAMIKCGACHGTYTRVEYERLRLERGIKEQLPA